MRASPSWAPSYQTGLSEEGEVYPPHRRRSWQLSAVGNFVADMVRPYAEQREVPWLPTAVQVLILLFGVLAALDLLEIRFAEDLVKIVTAGIVIAFAVAFGIGGIDTAKKW
jgi:hypothetical protein